MTDFFVALEQELRAAGERRPRWRPDVPAMAGWIGAGMLTAVAAAIAALLVLGGDADERSTPSVVQPDPVGTVIQKGNDRLPRRLRHIVVANGTTAGLGAWQLEFFRSTIQTDPETGEALEPARLPCLELKPLELRHPDTSGYCGIPPRTPGFTRNSFPAGHGRLIVYGQVPARATSVVLTAPRGVRVEAEPFPGPPGVPGDFYLLSTDQDVLTTARVNWLDADGRRGSRGLEVEPGSTGATVGSRPRRDATPSSAP